MQVAQKIFEDTNILKTQFPTSHKDWTAMYDVWKFTSRHCTVKGANRDINVTWIQW